MIDNNTLPFSLIEDDEFISLFYDDGRNNVNYVRNTVFDNIATNVITNNLDELNLEFNTHDETGHIESSPYYTEASFKQHAATLGKDELFFLHLNIRSANRNFEKLRLFLEYTELQTAPIIALSETWFTDTSTSGTVASLPNYNVATNNRMNKVGGGVAIYIPCSYDYVIKEEMKVMNDVIES